mmetsp:Transcript_28602/g.57118  ORF Transcript_28602/g.57118 Transcript_28602/m.57118 type:complete len:86 (+) Transcript_28602:191-448(+)
MVPFYLYQFHKKIHSLRVSISLHTPTMVPKGPERTRQFSHARISAQIPKKEKETCTIKQMQDLVTGDNPLQCDRCEWNNSLYIRL